MSDVETIEGKLIPIITDGLTLDEWIQNLLGRTELQKYEESWLEALSEEHYKEYFFDHESSTLFKLEIEELDPYSFTKISKNDDGSYDFLTSFYNGGASLPEVLSSALKRLEE